MQKLTSILFAAPLIYLWAAEYIDLDPWARY